MMTCKVPTVGVSAFPLDHSLFEWACNIMGPQGTKYEGGVYHFHLHFPSTYPHHPPVVQVRSSFPHPNIFGVATQHRQAVCLSMLESERKGIRGWSSAYTVQSVLLQLQSFLFT